MTVQKFLFYSAKLLIDPFILSRLHPSKLDLDVLTAIAEVNIDSAVYPSITQWKRLVTSYSEENQQR